jgi:hypothetical protein
MEGHAGREQQPTGAYSLGRHGSTPPASSEVGTVQKGLQALLPPSEAESFWERWKRVQAAFVDNPRQALDQANGLVGEVMKRLIDIFAEEQRNLEGKWASGEDVTTEEMRVALQHYRDFFERLLLTSKPGPDTHVTGVA